MVGTWINVGAVLLGGGIGLLGARVIPESFVRFAPTAVGLLTLILGVRLALEAQDLLVLLIALLIGGGLGTWARLEDRLAGVGEAIERRFPRLGGKTGLVPGFLTASLLFCIGPMAVLGSIRDGIYGDWQILGLKSVLDGVCSVAFTAALGPGVLLAILPLLVYQGGITLAAHFAVGSLPADWAASAPLVALDAVGGALLIALSVKLLGVRDLKIGNLLPALAFAPLLAFLSGLVRG